MSGDERSKYNELAATDLASYRIRMTDYRELQYQNSLLNQGPAREESPVLQSSQPRDIYRQQGHSQQIVYSSFPRERLEREALLNILARPSTSRMPRPQLVPTSQQHNTIQEVPSLPRNIQLALQSSQPRDIYHQQGNSQQIVLSNFLRERLEREALLNILALPNTSRMPRLTAFLPEQQQEQQQQDESFLTRFLRRPGEVQQDMVLGSWEMRQETVESFLIFEANLR
jgi:hypothetical protein